MECQTPLNPTLCNTMVAKINRELYYTLYQMYRTVSNKNRTTIKRIYLNL